MSLFNAASISRKRNEPSYVKLVAEEIANLKGISYEEVAEMTTKNAKVLFELNKRTGETCSFYFEKTSRSNQENKCE